MHPKASAVGHRVKVGAALSVVIQGKEKLIACELEAVERPATREEFLDGIRRCCP
jgi:hypothetical protein